MHAIRSRDDGGMFGMDIDGKSRAVAETLAGTGLMTLPYWSKLLDQIVTGAHFVAAICGAIIAVNGVYRLFFRTQRRRSDNSTSA